jgi:hypothetical protein
VAAVLFALLSPGLLLTIPAESKGVWMSGQTSTYAILVHTVVFAVVLGLISWLLKKLIPPVVVV